MKKRRYASLHPGPFKLDGGAMFGIIPKPLWEKHIHPDELNRIEMSLRVFLIQEEDRTILIDSGIGDYHGEKFNHRFGLSSQACPLEHALQTELQLDPDQVTDLIIGHLHFDHVGGLLKLKEGKVTPVFPNATLYLHKKHYEYSLKPTPRDSGSFQSHFFVPLIEHYIQNNQIVWLDKEEGEILQLEEGAIQFKTSHGHTPYQVHAFDQHFIFLGDLLPTSHHLAEPWVMGYDIQPGVCSIEKTSFYDFIIQKDLTIIFDHDLKFWGGKLQKSKEKYFWDQLFSCQKSSQFIELE